MKHERLDRVALQAFVRGRYDFGECLIESLEVVDNCSGVRLVVRYIWDLSSRPERVLPDDEHQYIEFNFRFVKSLSLVPPRLPDLTIDPDEVPWGVSEFAVMEVGEALPDESDARVANEGSFSHVALIWEGDSGRVDIIYSHVDVAIR